MSDLISRKSVMDIIQDELNLRIGYDADVVLLSVKKRVSELPTAYDIDKVVEELKKASWEETDISTVVYIEEAIEIVKQGGVSDDVCKWKQTSTAKYKTSCGYKLEEYFDTKACFCKQCGKKIKVID